MLQIIALSTSMRDAQNLLLTNQLLILRLTRNKKIIMKLKVLLTVDDRTKQIGGKPEMYHRNAIGIESAEQSVITTHIYPEPDKWHIIAMYFPSKPYKIVACIQAEDKDQLVATNKKNLTKLGSEIIAAGLEAKIKQVYEGTDNENPVNKFLKPHYFAELNFNFIEGEINFEGGILKLIHPGKPNGLLTKPKIEF